MRLDHDVRSSGFMFSLILCVNKLAELRRNLTRPDNVTSANTRIKRGLNEFSLNTLFSEVYAKYPRAHHNSTSVLF